MIGVIADDLSGAAELGAMGTRHGLRAEILLDGAVSGGADLVCVDTDSRSCSAEDARKRARAAASQLVRAEARWIYKKTDSVLRGNVVTEIEGLMEELGLKLAVLLPANPNLGRVVRGGKYFIHGKPINETEFGRDPEYPRTSAEVIGMLGGSANVPLSVQRATEPLPESGIVVGEAETPDDLREWARQINTGMLAAGAAEFFETLLIMRAGKILSAEIPVDFESEKTGELFVSGSMSESAREFVESERKAGAAVFELPKELATCGEFSERQAEALAREAVAALGKHQRVILSVGLPLVREPVIARNLSAHLVQVAELVLKRGEVGHVFAEGGATAVAVARRMGWTRMNVERELARGVATVSVGAESGLTFSMKPGSYVWPDTVRGGKV